ncbi:uncharacterized protein [Chironomus tepperi]|uniref:uncharacterized protein n=1 Tax=Chironomus tepperi TaxID=113505 RepID=UPI00391F626C
MKLSLFLISIFLFYIIDAATLKKLSDKLSITDELEKIKSTKEKLPSDELIISEIYGNRNDGEVSELNNLKFAKEKNQIKDLDEIPENSLKKLHNLKGLKSFTNVKHNQINEKPSQQKLYSQEGSSENFFIPNEIFEFTTESNKIKYLSKNESFINPYTMLRDSNGKYSAYEIAQYIFWTGDEAGIANAMEELIDERLMTRENAIEFLNDIRLGIDYLENKYKTDDNKNVFARNQKTTASEPFIDNEIPFTYNFMKPQSFSKTSFQEKIKYENNNIPTLSPMVVKALERIPSLVKLAEIHQESKNKHQSKPSESDENMGRAYLKDFIFGEYSLEEVIYQLAKTMFTQSLTNESEESQAALQNLTQFLDTEGKRGRISPILQKKVLDVLLTALSDTLSENPKILKKTHLTINE